jgi:parvulin-like peptidyl-prolyl isomerase
MAKHRMRFMQTIREKGGLCLGIFLGFFLISVFAGLGVGFFTFRGCAAQPGFEQQQTTRRVALDPSPTLAKIVMKVNSEPVTEQEFYRELNQLLETMREGGRDDPGMALLAYGHAANRLLAYAVIRQRGQDLGINVTSADVAEEKDQALAGFMSSEAGSTGNVLGDIARRLGSQRERKRAFSQYLERQGLNEQQWLERTKNYLFLRKTQEELQRILDEEKALAASETKAIIDQRLADGEAFTDLAEQFSEVPGANSDAIWLGRDLVLPQQEEALFNTPVGEITDWIEVPSGWYRFEVVDKKIAEGEEFEAKREELVGQLKGEHAGEEDYEPSEDEIKQKYEQVQARQLQLRIDDPGAAERDLAKLGDQAEVEINDPYVLAYQALYDSKLQPTGSMGLEQLTNIAQSAAPGEDYDFELIRAKLDKGRPQQTGPVTEEPAQTGQEGADGAPDGAAPAAETEALEPSEERATAPDVLDGEGVAEGEDEAVAEEEVSPATGAEPSEDEFFPIYALAVGLFKLAIQENEEPAGYFPYYIIAKTYLDWLGDEEERKRQAIDRATAREEVETNLARAAERYEYSCTLHAERGLNLAWLDRDEEALASLALAEKYASQEADDPIWDTVREAYEVLDAQAQLTALEEKLAEYRRAAFQRQIEQAQREAEQRRSEGAVTIPSGDATTGDGDAGETGGASTDETAQDAGEENGEGE